MNPFKRLSEITVILGSISKKNSRKAVQEIRELNTEAERLRKIIESNPCLIAVG